MSYDELDASDARLQGVRTRLVGAQALNRARAVLTAQELDRQRSFGDDGRRRHFALGRLALRTLAGEALGEAPDSVDLRVAEDGAVELAGWHVSLSHGGEGEEAVGFAALGDRPIGVDVEPIRARRADLWTRILRPDERPVLDALGGPSDLSHTLLWSMKEAVLKGQRTGLRAGARSVRLTLGDEAGPSSGAATAEADASGAWAVRYQRRGDLWLVVAVATSST